MPVHIPLSCACSHNARDVSRAWLYVGNDLARVLNWGGSLGSYASHRARDMLRAVSQSTVALLDRWNVSIQPTVRLLDCTAVNLAAKLFHIQKKLCWTVVMA